MDDWLQSVDEEEGAVKLVMEVKEVHRRGGFAIGKWMTNLRKLTYKLKNDQSTTPSENLAGWSDVVTERVLGLHWLRSKMF